MDGCSSQPTFLEIETLNVYGRQPMHQLCIGITIHALWTTFPDSLIILKSVWFWHSHAFRVRWILVKDQINDYLGDFVLFIHMYKWLHILKLSPYHICCSSSTSIELKVIKYISNSINWAHSHSYRHISFMIRYVCCINNIIKVYSLSIFRGSCSEDSIFDAEINKSFIYLEVIFTDVININVKLTIHCMKILITHDFYKQYLRMVNTLIEFFFISVPIKCAWKMSVNNDDTNITVIENSNDEEESNAKGKKE